MKGENLKDFAKDLKEDFNEEFDAGEKFGIAILLLILGAITVGILSLFFFFPVVMFTITLVVITFIAIGAGVVTLALYVLRKISETKE